VNLIDAYIQIRNPTGNLTSDDWNEMGTIAVAARKDIRIGFELFPTNGIQSDNVMPSDLSRFPPEDQLSNPEISACEDVGIFSISEFYRPTKLFLNTDGYLTRKIPFWIAKLLMKLHILEENKNGYLVKDRSALPIHYEIINEAPLRPLCETILDLGEEESELVKIIISSKKLSQIYDTLTFKLQDLNISKARLLSAIISSDLPDTIASLQNLLKSLEQAEKELRIPYVSDIKVINTHLNEDRDNILKSQTQELEPIYVEQISKSAAVVPTKSVLEMLNREIDIQAKFLARLTQIIDPILQKIKETLAATESIQNKISNNVSDLIFKGKSFPLYALDINNLHVSLKEKFGKSPGHRQPIPNRLQTYFFPRDRPFRAVCFASKHLQYYQKWLPPSDFVQWNIEDKIKRIDPKGFTVYCDVDTNLTALIYNFIERHHSQIEAFYLGSGDKDLMIVTNLANQYHIPVRIIVIDEKNLAHELRQTAEKIFELY
jgi:hypothetical protein